MPRNKNLMTGVVLVPFTEKPEEGKIALTGKTLQAWREARKANEAFKEAQAHLHELVKAGFQAKDMLEEGEEPILSWNFDRFQVGMRPDDRNPDKLRVATKRGRRTAESPPVAVAKATKGLSL